MLYDSNQKVSYKKNSIHIINLSLFDYIYSMILYAFFNMLGPHIDNSIADPGESSVSGLKHRKFFSSIIIIIIIKRETHQQ